MVLCVDDIASEIVCGDDRVGAFAERRGHVHGRHEPPPAFMEVDGKHLVDQLVLAEVDVASAERLEHGLEYGASRSVVALPGAAG